jgi:hypothetical protein
LARADGLCNDGAMAKTVIVKLTDDIDGSDADETIHFALDGRTYEIDVSAANATKIRQVLQPFIEKGRPSNTTRNAKGRSTPRTTPAEMTMYSELTGEEKNRFRAWADMPTARRISDARVKSWMAAGKP